MSFHPSAFQFAFPHGVPAVTTMTTPAPPMTKEFIKSSDFHSLDVTEIAAKYARKATVSGQISAAELCNMLTQQSTSRLQPFIEVTNLCYTRMKKLAQSGLTSCRFDVPLFVSGIPLFDAKACTEFIACHLKANGYSVYRSEERTLLIEWYVMSHLPEEVPNTVPNHVKLPENSPPKSQIPNTKIKPTRAKKILPDKMLTEDKDLFKSISLLRPSGKFSLDLK